MSPHKAACKNWSPPRTPRTPQPRAPLPVIHHHEVLCVGEVLPELVPNAVPCGQELHALLHQLRHAGGAEGAALVRQGCQVRLEGTGEDDAGRVGGRGNHGICSAEETTRG